ncbi:hypothetical protein GUITHDRAFT_78114, partial [Guillardia theta CCMP2712]
NAFYSEVEGKGIMQGLASLAAGGTPARFLIIDDGWQDTSNDEVVEATEERKREAARDARDLRTPWNLAKRISLPGGDLGEFVNTLKTQMGVQQVLCWHALAGYWSGLRPSSPSFQSLSPSINRPSPMEGILEVEPQLSWDPLTLGGIGLPRGDRTLEFYHQLHSYLRSNNVDGLKVDAQAAFTMLGEGNGGTVKVTQKHIHMMEESVSRHFGSSNCINCMCHPTECLYSYKERQEEQTTSIVRASDDFWPDDPASHTTHLVNVAYNSLFLGEIAQPDWDMFQSDHPTSHIHAIARAVGGCSVYVSDKPERHNFDLLRRYRQQLLLSCCMLACFPSLLLHPLLSSLMAIC